MDWLKKKIDQPEIEYWPEVRWWLAEAFHTDKTLKLDIDIIYNSGFGAVEFLAMDEDGADSSRYGWGSEEWVHDSHLVIEEATRRGMGASFTSGTNWATANLVTILPDDKAASKELNFTFETLAAGQSRTGPLSRVEITQPGVHEQILIAVVAGRRVSRTHMGAMLDEKSLVVLTDRVVDGCLDWIAPSDGIYELMVFWMHGTGQTAEPAQGIAYTVNYVDRYGVDALTKYWDDVVLTPELKRLITENGRVQMYMDSLELKTYGKGGQFWGYTLLDEFKKRRGYDLTPYLPYVVRPYDRMMIGMHHHIYEPLDPVFAEKMRNDLCQVQTELYIDNMLEPFRQWLHKNGMTLRAEISYGMPYDISLPGKYVDGIEGESLDFACQPDSFRSLGGAAHLFGKGFSSETGAHRHNFMVGLDFYNQIIFTQFAAGVSRTVLHGYSSIVGSEKSTRWPGHEGMWPVYSDRFDIRQPFWKHFNDWTSMLARFQMILRQGKPRRDIAILRLDYHFNGKLHRINGIPEKTIYETMYLRANEGIYWRDMKLQNAGYTYDYLAPQLLEDEDVSFADGVIQPDGPAYRAVLVYQEQLPLSSAKRLLKWAKQGLRVVLVNGAAEMVRNEIYVTHHKAASKTPYHDNLDAELAVVINELKSLPNVRELDEQSQTLKTLAQLGVAARSPFSERNANILTVTRDSGNVRYLFVYNYMYTEEQPFSFTVGIEGEGKPYLVDCWKNKVDEIGLYKHSGGYTHVTLTLSPGEATVVALAISEKDAIHAVSAQGCRVLQRNGNLAIAADKSGTCTVTLSDGTVVTKELEVSGNILLQEWELEVEDWNEGEKRTVTEDRGLGYETREVYYKTKKTRIAVGKTTLKPWRVIEAVGPEVSGLGYYTASFALPDGCLAKHGAVLKLGSTCGGSFEVFVNGKKTPPVDYAKLEADITDLLVEGENTVQVEVSSNLNNRLVSRGYFVGLDDTSGMVVDGKPKTVDFGVQDYGLIGDVCVAFYAIAEL